jgi:hypothetical protein
MQTVERPRTGLIIAGAAVFGASYLTNVLIAYTDWSDDEDFDGTGPLLVPVVGPLLLLEEADEQLDTFLVLDTLVQTAGLTMLIVGLVSKRQVLEPVRRDTRALSVAPVLGPRTVGATLSMPLGAAL